MTYFHLAYLPDFWCFGSGGRDICEPISSTFVMWLLQPLGTWCHSSFGPPHLLWSGGEWRRKRHTRIVWERRRGRWWLQRRGCVGVWTEVVWRCWGGRWGCTSRWTWPASEDTGRSGVPTLRYHAGSHTYRRHPATPLRCTLCQIRPQSPASSRMRACSKSGCVRWKNCTASEKSYGWQKDSTCFFLSFVETTAKLKPNYNKSTKRQPRQ